MLIVVFVLKKTSVPSSTNLIGKTNKKGKELISCEINKAFSLIIMYYLCESFVVSEVWKGGGEIVPSNRIHVKIKRSLILVVSISAK